MDQTVRVGVVQCGSHLPDQPDRLLHRKLWFSGKPLPERSAPHVRHDVVQPAAGFAGVVEGQDVRMGELRGNLDLAEEPGAADRLRQLGAKNLDGYLSVVLQILREINRSHGKLV